MAPTASTAGWNGLSLASLASGSRGNCTWVGSDHAGFLIDCGISARQVINRMDAIGLGGAPVDGVLVTHDHHDHVAAAAVLDRRIEQRTGRIVPFYATAGTWAGVPESRRPRDVQVVTPGVPLRVQGWTLEPHTVPHDTRDPIAWAIDTGSARAAVITDLGHVTRLVEAVLRSVDVAVVEFNHDVELLLEGSYPWALKQRIRGRHGHLSNADAAGLLRRAANGRLQHVLLGHLSDENNKPELALDAALRALHDAGAPRISVSVASQDQPSDAWRVRPPAPALPRATKGSPNQLALFGA